MFIAYLITLIFIFGIALNLYYMFIGLKRLGMPGILARVALIAASFAIFWGLLYLSYSIAQQIKLFSFYKFFIYGLVGITPIYIFFIINKIWQTKSKFSALVQVAIIMPLIISPGAIFGSPNSRAVTEYILTLVINIILYLTALYLLAKIDKKQ